MEKVGETKRDFHASDEDRHTKRQAQECKACDEKNTRHASDAKQEAFRILLLFENFVSFIHVNTFVAVPSIDTYRVKSGIVLYDDSYMAQNASAQMRHKNILAACFTASFS